MRLIDADAAIDTLKELTANGTNKGMVFGEDAVHRIEILPSAQPEIIRCKDCKYMIDTGDDLMCDNSKGWVVATASDFGCVLAERRTDG